MSRISDESQAKVVRRPVVYTGTALAVLCFQTLGTIYSDIGTSPLYVLNGIWPASGDVPPKDDVIGGVSAIIWALTILPLIKYVVICMRFGTVEGEGGTFALYNGLFPNPEIEEDDRTLTSDSAYEKSHVSGIRGQSTLRRFKWVLLPWTLFGTALTLSDGIFTPAVSVTSAVAGIAVAKESVLGDITPISIAFLVALFLVQRFGTARLTSVFAPITFGWLVLLAATGIVNITKFPGIFRAIDPSRAIMWFVRTKEYDYLAGVLLAVTGCEAMFANLGQFNALSIQLSFSLFVYPALVLAYLGQGARLVMDGESVMSNIFFNTIPGQINGPLYWIIFVFSILATLIASQALITATFSLTQQLINMRSLPPLKMIYTSSAIQGQVYVPVANYVLGIATIIVVAAFKDLAALTNAYGFAVATVMFVTTSFLAIQLWAVKKQPIFLAVGFLVVFGFFDGIFWGASLRKVPKGAYVPLAIGSVLTILMLFWTWAKGLEDEFDGKNRRNPRNFIVNKRNLPYALAKRNGGSDAEKPSLTSTEDIASLPHDPDVHIVEESVGHPEHEHTGINDGPLTFVDETGETTTELVRLPTCAVFHKLTAGKGVPHSFYAFIKQLPALPRVVIFLSVRVVPIAYVGAEDRYLVSKVRSIPGFYGVTYRLGFRDDFEPSTADVIELICSLETRAEPRNARRIVAEIRDAARRSSHIIPHYEPVSKGVRAGWATPVVAWVRRFLIEGVYKPLATMFPETDNWNLDNEDILRVGVNALI